MQTNTIPGATAPTVQIKSAHGEILADGHPSTDHRFPDLVFRTWLPPGTDPRRIGIYIDGEGVRLVPKTFNGKRGYSVHGPARGQLVRSRAGWGVTLYVAETAQTAGPAEARPEQLALFAEAV